MGDARKLFFFVRANSLKILYLSVLLACVLCPLSRYYAYGAFSNVGTVSRSVNNSNVLTMGSPGAGGGEMGGHVVQNVNKL